MEQSMLFAGFGGQGILFLGRVIATAGLIEGKHVTWLPSYGPEMRGGTANCSVILSDTEIGSPIITSPTTFVAMNKPSYDKFMPSIKDSGYAFLDSSLITDFSCGTNNNSLNIFKIPATQLANENNVAPLANMVMLGKLVKELKFTSFETILRSVKSCIPERFAGLTDKNIAALELGYSQ